MRHTKSGISTHTQHTIKKHQIPALRVGISAPTTLTLNRLKFMLAARERDDETLDLIQDIQNYLNLHVEEMQQEDINYAA
jgi:hypothetical protein